MNLTSGEMLAMNAMRAIYVRSVVLVLGFAALLLIEQLAPPRGSVPAGNACWIMRKGDSC